MTPEAATGFAADFRRLVDAVSVFVQGKQEVVELAVTCLLAEGHLLLEDVPGVGKTSLARSLAGAFGAGWSRIQFTPDLLPSDVTGVSVYHQDRQGFVFHPGPVFAPVVLADELNRASPRTQSALLEVMEERTVTVDGESRAVPRPFVVIATQNPVELDGTYPLPEAQLDRFLVRASLGYPDHDSEVRIVAAHHAGRQVGDVPVVMDAPGVQALIDRAAAVFVAPQVQDYLVRLVARTRSMPEVELGASPRGSVGLLRASRIRAAAAGRGFVTPLDVRSLAPHVLAHRLVLAAGYQARGGTAADAVALAVQAVPVPERVDPP